MPMTPKHPSLYRLGDDGQSVLLLFGQCPACRALTFPADAYGCATCGAEGLQRVERPGRGRLQAAVTLHAAALPHLPVPQSVGDVEIAPGIVEEVLIEDDAGALSPGQEMVAVPHPLEDGAFDCRFRAAG